ncbi:MAG TPA: hypothetical protein VF676_01035 [Flavobacterium sp.]|jgi:hypothetical protein
MKLPQSKHYRYWLVAFSAVSTIFIVLLSDTRYSVLAMLKLEFAQTQQYFFSVQRAYNYSDQLLTLYMYFDFAFIVAFGVLFCLSAVVLADIRNKRSRPWYSILCCLPGFLDIIEDLLMLKMFHNDGVREGLFNTFIVVALSKWILVLPCIGIALGVLLYPFLWKKIEKQKQ